MSNKDIIIVGGGVSGLISAINVAREGLEVVLVEQKSYPFHKVCGEYFSNEILPLLEEWGIDIGKLNPAYINEFQVTSLAGRSFYLPLDLGGFGISRYHFDYHLYEIAKASGVTFLLNSRVTDISFQDDHFEVLINNKEKLSSKLVIGTYGKRASLDRKLNREFFHRRSPYMAVKYHIKLDFPTNLIALHNFKDGYCGISKIEDDRYCLCYLTRRSNLQSYGSIPEMEQKLLSKNPYLKTIFKEAEFLFTKPLVINEISFRQKDIVNNHMLMAGDAAGLITPLCGNGLAMAIHGGTLLAYQTIRYFRGALTRTMLEQKYQQNWRKHFQTRLQTGRLIQGFFGGIRSTEWLIGMANGFPKLGRGLMKMSHGSPVNPEMFSSKSIK